MSALLDHELAALLAEAREDAQSFDRSQRAANQRRYREERDPSLLRPDQHGRASTYSNWKCRCAACREAWRIACQARREAKRAAA